MQQETSTAHKTALTNFDDMTISEIGEELERGLQAIYEEKWPRGNKPRAEIVKAAVIVHYGPPGHRVKMSRVEAVRFLDIIAEMVPGTSKAIQEGIASDV